jgi:streptogramin lyase
MTRLIRLTLLLLFAWAGRAEAVAGWTEFPVPEGSGPHDVAPAPDGMVWFTAQAAGALGRLDPRTGHVDKFSLGDGSAPHGVIVGPDGAPWVTDGGLNAILRVDPASHAIRRFPLPAGRAGANLNTATFDKSGALWFTGQAGVYGRVDAGSGAVRVWDAPRGPGAYGITTTPAGAVYFASLAGSYIARVSREYINHCLANCHRPRSRERRSKRATQCTHRRARAMATVRSSAGVTNASVLPKIRSPSFARTLALILARAAAGSDWFRAVMGAGPI